VNAHLLFSLANYLEDDEKARAELEERYPNLEMLPEKDCACFRTERGEEFIPELVREFGVKIKAISLHRPTLDDVFLKLTGREIRDEGSDSAAAFRTMARAQGRK
jgi:ABC-2 type transport system ATP-binding protein